MNITDPPLKPDSKNIIHGYYDTQPVYQYNYPFGCFSVGKSE